jgi:nitrate/TMAO reductase-like tetraheme cytochrome c subunit
MSSASIGSVRRKTGLSIKRETQKRRVLDSNRQQAREPKSNDSENCQKAHRPDEEVAWRLHGATMGK